MLIWILMLADLFALIIASLAQFNVAVAGYLLIYSGLYLILKFALFREVMSGIDAVFGVYLLLVAIFHFSSFMYYFMLGWFVYKFASTLSSFMK